MSTLGDTLYPWNSRLKELKQSLLDYKEGNFRESDRVYKKAFLEVEVHTAINEFQPTYAVLIMKWANEAGIGPGFVVD